MKRRFITVIILVPLATAMFVYPHLSPTAAETNAIQQNWQSHQKRRTSWPNAGKSMTDYSRFSHRSRGHQQACSACHKIPTPNWRAARGYPDVADYPDHNACVGCHRQQFFKGTRPSICAICHTKVSPRDDARFAFRKPNAARQFTDLFPHDRHQDVIALNGAAPRLFEDEKDARFKDEEGARFVLASFERRGTASDDKAKKFNNCSICHEPNQTTPQPPPGGWPDAFVPTADFFKTAPRSHASCFNCHWKSQEPTKDNCAGCHKAAAEYFPASWPRRVSIKFTHAREQHTAECTVCHINITGASTLKGLKPDVPVSSCAPCHKTSTSLETVTLEIEMGRRQKDSNYTCTKCHTSDVGRKSVPASHTVLFLE